MIQATSDTGMQWILDCERRLHPRGLEVKCGINNLIYKGKGDPMECGSYRGIKLMEHAMTVVERIFEHRNRQQIDIDNMHFGFIKGKRTTDAIFIAMQAHAGEV